MSVSSVLFNVKNAPSTLPSSQIEYFSYIHSLNPHSKPGGSRSPYPYEVKGLSHREVTCLIQGEAASEEQCSAQQTACSNSSTITLLYLYL